MKFEVIGTSFGALDVLVCIVCMSVACNIVNLKLMMNKAWDGNSVGEYVSCMKINGVPLLPPIMTEECRKEMQYYKLLAIAVEKRLSDLAFLDKEKYATIESSPKTNSPFSHSENNTSNIPEKEEKNIDEHEPVPNGFESILSDVTVIDNIKDLNEKDECLCSLKTSIFNQDEPITEFTTHNTQIPQVPNRLTSPKYYSQIDRYMPAERNLDCIQTKIEEAQKVSETKERPNVTINLEKDIKRRNVFKDKKQRAKEKPLQNTKNLSGSLNDISFEPSQPYPKLVRQRSYTIENPSPMLLAHLEVQYVTSGVDMSSISMSESCSNIPSECKKRRSWDLVTAKMKWSSMATELNRENVSNQATEKSSEMMPNKRILMSNKSGKKQNENLDKNTCVTGKENTNPSECKTGGVEPPVFNIYVSQEKTPPHRIPTVIRYRNGREAKSERNQKPVSKSLVHSASKNLPSRNTKSESSKPNRDFSAKLSMITTPQTADSKTPTKLVSNNTTTPPSWDACIKDLYKRIQNQQLKQMKVLIDKQKTEQLHLQKDFEDQTNTFFKQIKTMYPELAVEGDRIVEDRINSNNDNCDELSLNDDKMSSVKVSMNETDHYIQLTDEVLKKSRNVMDSVKRLSPRQTIIRSETMTLARDTTVTEFTMKDKSYSVKRDNGVNKNCENVSKLTPLSRFRKSSTTSSQSSQGVQDDIILTDRTNDTFADLNFTLSNDTTDDASRSEENNTHSGQPCSSRIIHKRSKIDSPQFNGKNRVSPMQHMDPQGLESNDNLRDYCAIPVNNSAKEYERKSTRRLFSDHTATKTEREAASRIVAHAKGYLVRRLLKTERVQATVQTIRDALVCALQLHQDREGIRGADIDLHRRLIQQITAACYTLHDTFINSNVSERCQYIAQDRERKRALQVRQGSANSSMSHKSLSASKKLAKRKMDVMSHSHLGVFTSRSARSVPSHAMSNSSYETLNADTKMYLQTSRKYLHSTKELHNKRPWR